MSEAIPFGNNIPESQTVVGIPKLSLYRRVMAHVATYRESPIRGQDVQESIANQHDGVGDYLAQKYPTDVQTVESWAIADYVIPTPSARHAKSNRT